MIAKKKEEKGHIVLEQVDLIYIVVMCVVAMCANTTKDLFFTFRNAAGSTWRTHPAAGGRRAACW